MIVDQIAIESTIDEVCDAYEEQLRADQNPNLEDYLSIETEPERTLLLSELLHVKRELQDFADVKPDELPSTIAKFDIEGIIGRGALSLIHI